MFALDTIILAADLSNTKVMLIRFGICLVLACFHSLTLDTYAFKDDINNYLKKQYSMEWEKLDSVYREQKITPLLASKEALYTRNQELFNEEKESRDRVYKEVNEGENGRPPGWGPYALDKMRFHSADSTAFANERISNDAAIKLLDDQIGQLRLELNQKKADLNSPNEAGLMENINALHHLVWGEQGRIGDRFFFILFFFIGILFESLVLLSKLAFGKAFMAYQNEEHLERQLVATQQEQKRERKRELEELEQQIHHQRKISRLTIEAQSNMVQDDNDAIIKKLKERIRKSDTEFNLIAKALLDVDKSDEQLKNQLNGLYEPFGKPLINSRLEHIKQILGHLKRAAI